MKSNEFNYAWLSDPEIFEVNRQPAHADFDFYANDDEYQKQETQLKQNLNGMWRILYAKDLNQNVKGFDFHNFGYPFMGLCKSSRTIGTSGIWNTAIC